MIVPSWVAIERIVQRDEPGAKRPLRIHFAGLPDDELLTLLRACGIDLSRDELAAECSKHVSVEALTLDLDRRGRIVAGKDRWATDRVWTILLELWLRWFPEIPVFERLDDEIALGYQMNREGQEPCEAWLRAWAEFRKLFDKMGLVTVAEFDKRFLGTESVHNWMQELADALWAVPPLYEDRVRVCEDILRMLPPNDQLTAENTRRSLAETHFELGHVKEAEAMFRQWLDSNPRWGWGWIGWADCYRFTRTAANDLAKAEAILVEGLNIEGVEDRRDIGERLHDVYQDQGKTAEADELSARMREEYQRKTGYRLGRLAGVEPVRVVKTGRNDPCPCGSGKKYKKCCLK